MRRKRAKLFPGAERLGPNEPRPKCPKCGGPVSIRKRGTDYYVCPGCCGFTARSTGFLSLEPNPTDDELPPERSRRGAKLRRCYGRTLQILEAALGPDLTQALRRQAEQG